MSETAKVLYITPSAASHAIKRLRSVLNDPAILSAKGN
ncbi:hypothetical protein ACOBV8_18105 (plasmid) [Pseudoalteromonas espejiana]